MGRPDTQLLHEKYFGPGERTFENTNGKGSLLIEVIHPVIVLFFSFGRSAMSHDQYITRKSQGDFPFKLKKDCGQVAGDFEQKWFVS